MAHMLSLEKWLMNSVNNMHHSTFKSVGGLWIVYHTRSSQVLLNVLPQILIRPLGHRLARCSVRMYSLWSSGKSSLGFHFEIFNSMNDDGVSIQWNYTFGHWPHINRLPSEVAASHPDQIQMHDAHSFGHITLPDWAMCFISVFWCLHKRPRMVTCHMYICTTRTEHTY